LTVIPGLCSAAEQSPEPSRRFAEGDFVVLPVQAAACPKCRLRRTLALDSGLHSALLHGPGMTPGGSNCHSGSVERSGTLSGIQREGSPKAASFISCIEDGVEGMPENKLEQKI
jgi:hypothetical protein